MEIDFQAIQMLEASVYGAENFRTAESLESLHKAWPHGFTVLWDEDADPPRMMAVGDVWCLNHSWFQTLCNGAVREESLSISHICKPSKQDKSQCWYIASMIVAPEYRAQGIFNKLAQAVWEIIKKYSAPSYTLMGVASSEAGWRILRRWAFKPWVETPGLQNDRIDLRPRYIKIMKCAKPCQGPTDCSSAPLS